MLSTVIVQCKGHVLLLQLCKSQTMWYTDNAMKTAGSHTPVGSEAAVLCIQALYTALNGNPENEVNPFDLSSGRR